MKKLPKFNREKVFAEVDKSNKRFDKYTEEERKKIRNDFKWRIVDNRGIGDID